MRERLKKQAVRGGRKPLQGSQELRAVLGNRWTDVQETAPTKEVSCLAVTWQGGRIQEAVEGSNDGVLKASLWRLDQKKAWTPHTGDDSLWTPDGKGGRWGWAEEPHSSHHRATGK